ncbi:hypothetical protein VP01_76g9 [Puccinia sorghi]|uniref:Uncharacterized protein n=1 Tax=Puccinia sorghi TaxID=27349 RepID=A0A0L6UBN0_9BASI|nr:hypothetical protein VP01_76g9 [Puccinia sorghi]
MSSVAATAETRSHPLAYISSTLSIQLNSYHRLFNFLLLVGVNKNNGLKFNGLMLSAISIRPIPKLLRRGAQRKPEDTDKSSSAVVHVRLAPNPQLQVVFSAFVFCFFLFLFLFLFFPFFFFFFPFFYPSKTLEYEDGAGIKLPYFLIVLGCQFQPWWSDQVHPTGWLDADQLLDMLQERMDEMIPDEWDGNLATCKSEDYKETRHKRLQCNIGNGEGGGAQAEGGCRLPGLVGCLLLWFSGRWIDAPPFSPSNKLEASNVALICTQVGSADTQVGALISNIMTAAALTFLNKCIYCYTKPNICGVTTERHILAHLDCSLNHHHETGQPSSAFASTNMQVKQAFEKAHLSSVFLSSGHEANTYYSLDLITVYVKKYIALTYHHLDQQSSNSIWLYSTTETPFDARLPFTQTPPMAIFSTPLFALMENLHKALIDQEVSTSVLGCSKVTNFLELPIKNSRSKSKWDFCNCTAGKSLTMLSLRLSKFYCQGKWSVMSNNMFMPNLDEHNLIYEILISQQDIEVFERLSEAQKECANQSWTSLFFNMTSFRLPSKIYRKISKQKYESIFDLPRSPRIDLLLYLPASASLSRYLENLINLKSGTITKNLEQIVEELQAKLHVTESNLTSFKCDQYPREMNFVKSGLEKVVNDLKEFFGETLANNSMPLERNMKNVSSIRCLTIKVDSSPFIRNRNYEVIRLASTPSS